MSNYTFRLDESPDCVIASFGGDISGHRYSELRDDYNAIYRALTASTRKNLVIDLTDTIFFGSLFAGMMMKLGMMVWQNNGRIALCGLSPQLEELLAD